MMWFQTNKKTKKLTPYSFMKIEEPFAFTKEENVQMEQDTIFTSLTKDPWFSFSISQSCSEVFLQFEMVSQIEGKSYLYFGYTQDGGIINPENRIYLDPDLCKAGVCLSFEEPVSILRVDPTDQEEMFSIKTLVLNAKNTNTVPETHNIKARNNELLMPFQESIMAYKERLYKYNRDINKVVILVTHEMDFSGAPQLCFNMGKELLKQGFFPVYLAFERGPAEDLFLQNSEWVFYAQRYDKGAQKQVIQALGEMGVRKAICNTVISGECIEIMKSAEIQTIALIHEMRAAIEICAAHEAAEKIAKNADVIVFPNTVVQKDFETEVKHSLTSKSIILPQGLYKKVDLICSKQEYANIVREKNGFATDDIVLVCAGVLTFGKGADLMISLLKEMYKMNSNLAQKTHIIWLGKPADKAFFAWLKMQIEKEGLENQIHLFGQITNVQDYYTILAGADMFLLLSREDPMPSVLMEAMYCETPAIAFYKSGGAEVLLDENRGELASFMDIEEMALKIDELLENSTMRMNIIEKAKEHVQENLNFSAYINKLTDFYK